MDADRRTGGNRWYEQNWVRHSSWTCSGSKSDFTVSPPNSISLSFSLSLSLSRTHTYAHTHRHTHTHTHTQYKRSLACPVPDQDWTEHLAWSPGSVKKGCPLLLKPL